MGTALIITGIQQGLLLALIAFAVMIPFRLLDLPDLSSEGAYPLGGAICACLLLANVSPLCSVLLASLAAGILGILTSLIHLRLKVNSLLAGIILSTMAYSVNLRIMGMPSLSLFNHGTLFSSLEEYSIFKIILLIAIITVAITPFILSLKTDLGLKFRAVGQNKCFAVRQGIEASGYIMAGFFFAGSLSGLAGAVTVQLQSYMDISMGVGIVIHALAALMIGEAICQARRSLMRQLIAPIIGALLYQQIQGVVLSSGLAPSDLKFFTASLLIIILFLQQRRKQAHSTT